MLKAIVILAACISFLIATSSAEAAQEKISVYADKKEVVFAVSPTTDKATTLVQMRPLFESLGIDLKWDNHTKTVTGQKGDLTFTLIMNQKTAVVNGKSISLTVPGRVTNGHTLVPLRFVAEATQSIVGWHGASQTISIYSREYVSMLGLSDQQAQQQVNAGFKPASSSKGLRGLYANSSADLLGNKGCQGVCWNYLYFIDDSRLIDKEPIGGGWETVDCTKDQCSSYEIKNGELVIDGKVRYSYEKNANNHLILDGEVYTWHEPLHRPKLDGKYRASNYIGDALGTSLTTTSTIIFRPDGTFLDDKSISILTDGSDISGDGTGISSTHMTDAEGAGRYTVINHTILLEYKDGKTESWLFFRPDLNDRMYKIGGQDFLLDDSYNPDETKPDTSKPSIDKEDDTKQPLFEDKLTTDKIANKTIVYQKHPGNKKSLGDIGIELAGYQWAELEVEPGKQSMFQNFGSDDIVALTVKYIVNNNSSTSVNLSTLQALVWNTSGRVSDTPELSPTVSNIVDTGKSTEKLAVFLFPKEKLEELDQLEILFGSKAATGNINFNEPILEFDLDNPF